MVARRKANDLDDGLSLTGHGQAEVALAKHYFVPANGVSCWDYGSDASSKPIEEGRQFVPKAFIRRERRKLVRQHVLPERLQFSSVLFQIGENRYVDAFERAFLAEDIEENRSRWPRIAVSKKVDHIVEVTRPRTFGKRPHFFTE